MQLFMPDEQIIKINHEIDKIKKKILEKAQLNVLIENILY